jgi:cytochrome c biogenesis protein CcmG/thiol:disulfide interchange protein DsbE
MTKRNFYNHSLFKSAIIVALSGIILFSCGKKEEKKATPEKTPQKTETKANTDANMAPDFTLTAIDGKDVQLSDYLGKVVIIDFWATWCPPCKAEIPGFVELYEQYADAGLEIIGISLDQGDLSVVSNFVKSYNVNYPIVYYKDEVIMNYGGIRSIPTTFVVDREGKIVERLVGYKPKEFFEKLIKSIL